VALTIDFQAEGPGIVIVVVAAAAMVAEAAKRHAAPETNGLSSP
jgi:hypothetical protein